MKSEIKSLPPEFIERLRGILPPGKFDAVANTFAGPKPTTFRVNSLKTTPGKIQETLEQHSFRIEKVPWCHGAFVLKDGDLRGLQAMDCYRNGEIYVQSLSSMIPPLVLDPQPGETILDMTAAPGSKTTQMAALMKGLGRIVANDNNRTRFFKLKANVEMQGATNVELSLRYGETFGRRQPDAYDRILLDAPCSAEGRFDTREPASFRYWKPAKVKEMARKQKVLLASGIHALKPGGVLVYSTCTFAPEENEGVLDWALGKYEEIISIEKINLPLLNVMSGIRQWRDTAFHPFVQLGVRILPDPGMEGFFFAKIRKKS
ncbi:MAG: RsmB/NOP family class I SAM-dependent RNA methyltransferase [Candidatus Omnitrophica bacterium]|nr:RsmB/NOP family class I SAM-dependent RNA methyltransferase [Candidatus Omnitrophota bacterium]MDD5670089.1 RsmB/NOP family class I SAM-dependent RNA methyltransferase [Candidatus Omnitrophota bacterium]